MEIKYLDFYLNSKGELINSKLEALTQNSSNYSVRVFVKKNERQTVELAFLKADKSGYRGVYASYKGKDSEGNDFYEWNGTKELTNVAPYSKNDIELTISIKLDGVVANTIISKIVLYKSLDKYVKSTEYDDDAINDLSADFNDLTIKVDNNKADIENKLTEQNNDLIERITNGDNILAGFIDGKADKDDVYSKTETDGRIATVNSNALNYVDLTYLKKEKHEADIALINKTITDVNNKTVQDVNEKIDSLIDGAPGALDSLNELAQALGDNPNFATDTINTLNKKADKENVYTRDNVDNLLGMKVSYIEVSQIEVPQIDMWATNSYVDNKIVDYTAETLYSKADVDKRIKDAFDNVVTAESDLSVYAKKTYVNDLNAEQTIEILGSVKSDIDDLSRGVTSYVDGINSTLSQQVSERVTTAQYTRQVEEDLIPTVQSFKTSKADVEYVNNRIDNKITELIGNAPQALDTLKELAEALGDDPNFSTTITNELATKASITALNNKGVELSDMVDGYVNVLNDDINSLEGKIVKNENSIKLHSDKLDELEDLIKTSLANLQSQLDAFTIKETSTVNSVWQGIPSVGENCDYYGFVIIGTDRRVDFTNTSTRRYDKSTGRVIVSGSQYIASGSQVNSPPTFTFNHVKDNGVGF